jgi:ABC-type cobalamin/Fe3+-siderophores transport system ATPase subunit
MKLRRIKIIGTYKSIVGTEESPFEYKFKENKSSYSPFCLVGLNGSGKSNFIELISDIFGYADRFFNPQYICSEDLTYNFELEYLITGGQTTRAVLLDCKNSKLEMFTCGETISFRKDTEKELAKLTGVYEKVTSAQREMLPTNVVSYSSGHNQGLSSVFAKTQLQYFDVVRKQGVFYREYKVRYDQVTAAEDAEDDSVWENLSKYVKNTYDKNMGLFEVPSKLNRNREHYFKFPEEPLKPIEALLPIGLFTDHSLNNLVFLYLMICRGVNRDKSRRFRRFVAENVNISGFQSFEIDLRLTDYRDFETVENIVRRLNELSCESQGLPLPDPFEKISLSGTLHFKVNKRFLKGMERSYLDETIFLQHLLTLHHLTAKRWSNDEKNTLVTSKYERNVPNVSGGLMPMRIMNINIKLKEPNVKTLYDRLSDGEHQLIQVIGSLMLFDHQQTLFILDEPESHFNPEWRIEFVDIISKYIETFNLDLMISTHSPFILSACASERVLHFEKNEMGNVAIGSVDLETYGASFDTLLTSVFDLDVLISKKPLQEIREILNEYDTEVISDEVALDKLEPFGDSFELNFRRNKIRNIIADKSAADGQGED